MLITRVLKKELPVQDTVRCYFATIKLAKFISACLYLKPDCGHYTHYTSLREDSVVCSFWKII